jgi:hypothetical protein
MTLRNCLAGGCHGPTRHRVDGRLGWQLLGALPLFLCSMHVAGVDVSDAMEVATHARTNHLHTQTHTNTHTQHTHTHTHTHTPAHRHVRACVCSSYSLIGNFSLSACV